MIPTRTRWSLEYLYRQLLRLVFRRQPVAFVIGPYRSDEPGGVERNIAMAERTALELWRRGYAVICPHKNTAGFERHAPDDVWLQGYHSLLIRSDLAVTVAGWEDSSGSRAEVSLARDNGIPVYVHLSLVPRVRK